MDIGGGDGSSELQWVLKKLEDACSLLQNEQTIVKELEERRNELRKDLKFLRNEILLDFGVLTTDQKNESVVQEKKSSVLSELEDEFTEISNEIEDVKGNTEE